MRLLLLFAFLFEISNVNCQELNNPTDLNITFTASYLDLANVSFPYKYDSTIFKGLKVYYSNDSISSYQVLISIHDTGYVVTKANISNNLKIVAKGYFSNSIYDGFSKNYKDTSFNDIKGIFISGINLNKQIGRIKMVFGFITVFQHRLYTFQIVFVNEPKDYDDIKYNSFFKSIRFTGHQFEN